jgi:hypothetical protein
MDLKNKACDALLAHRVDNKVRGNKINSVINRIHVAQPKARDDVVRAPFIPEASTERKKYDKNDPERRKLLRDVELEEGGPGVFNVDMKRTSSYLFPLQYAHVGFQKTIYSRIPSGRRMSYLRSWTAKISRIS